MLALYSNHIISPLDSGKDYEEKKGYIVISGEEIVGLLPALPESFSGKVIDYSDKIIMPALVDSHTHSIFAGHRAKEFHMRMQGKSYVEIAKAGGGILSTVKSTRTTNDEMLAALLKKRLDLFLKNGVLTVEVKSGYALEHEGEIRLLSVIATVNKNHAVDVYSTYLGAHAIPFDKDRQEYIAEILEKTMPEIAAKKLAHFVDVFCDETAYTVSETKEILARAKDLGFNIKVHAEELVHTGISGIAATMGAVSADHLIKVSKEDLEVMKDNGTIPTLLPATVYMLKEDLGPTLSLLEMLNMAFAMASDFNPGSSPVLSPWNVIDIAIVQFGIPLRKVIPAFTLMGARALGLNDRGQIKKGKKAYLMVLGIDDPQLIGYLHGISPVIAVYKGETSLFVNDQLDIWI